MTLEERIARIEDRDQIRETIARYAHGLDLPDRDVFASVWTPDAVYRVDEPFGEVRGVEAIVAAWDTFQTIFVDMHHHTMNVIVDGPDGDRASSVSFALVTGTDAEGTAWTASCIYYDQFVKRDGAGCSPSATTRSTTWYRGSRRSGSMRARASTSTRT